LASEEGSAVGSWIGVTAKVAAGGIGIVEILAYPTEEAGGAGSDPRRLARGAEAAAAAAPELSIEDRRNAADVSWKRRGLGIFFANDSSQAK
jgi:hypothetical protein